MTPAQSPRRSLAATLSLIVLLAILGYGFFEARKILSGPQVTITYPINGSATSSSGVVISGEAHNISFLTINDKPAYTDEAGFFREVLSLPPGYAIFTVRAVDRFGRKTTQSVSITVLNYCPVH